jgi:uncharacterized surface anchored protein
MHAMTPTPHWTTKSASRCKPGETDTGNDFVDSDNGVISGSVKDDKSNPIPGTTITLKDSTGKVVQTTTTDSNGVYVFEDVEPGDYTLVESNLSEYPGDLRDFDTIPDGDTADSDKTTDNIIGVTIKPGESDVGNDFVDTNNGSISGSVKDDDGLPLIAIPLLLKAPDGSVVATTTTDSNGEYIFADVEPGNYTIVETNNPSYPVDISDNDSSPDGDAGDAVTTVDNSIGVTVLSGEKDTGNDFVDSNKGSITGTVKDDGDAPLGNVTITLTKPDGTKVTTVTDSNGEYTFVGLPPGDYTLTEQNPPGYPDNLSDYDETPDGDSGDSNTTPDNKIVVTIKPGEKDDGNNFVDILASATPSVVPSSSP